MWDSFAVFPQNWFVFLLTLPYCYCSHLCQALSFFCLLPRLLWGEQAKQACHRRYLSICKKDNCNLSRSFPVLAILVPFWSVTTFLVFFYLRKLRVCFFLPPNRNVLAHHKNTKLPTFWYSWPRVNTEILFKETNQAIFRALVKMPHENWERIVVTFQMNQFYKQNEPPIFSQSLILKTIKMSFKPCRYRLLTRGMCDTSSYVTPDLVIISYSRRNKIDFKKIINNNKETNKS